MNGQLIRLALVSTLWAFTQTVDATVFFIDAFSVVKNGVPYFEDTFANNSPPKHSNLENPAPVDVNPVNWAYLTIPFELSGPESDGLLQLDTFAGEAIDSDPVSLEPIEFVMCQVKSARRDNDAALWKDDLIEVKGRFMNTPPQLLKERFGITLVDWHSDEQDEFVANETIELIVRLEPGGVRIKLRQANYETHQFDTIDAWNPSFVSLEVARYFTEQVVRWGVVYDEPDIPIAVGILQLVTADPASVATAKMEVDAVIPAL